MRDTEREYLIELGKRIKAARKNKRLTTIGLANAIDMDKTNLNNVELGKANTKVLTLRRIATALEVDVKDLI